MNVVSNAGPLINLAKLGILYVLPQVYTAVVVPPAVYDEVVVRGKEQNYPDAYVVELAVARRDLILLPSPNLNPFEILQLQTARGAGKGNLLSSELSLSDTIQKLPIDQGEKQAIQLAQNIGYNSVLLDDLLAREAAQQLGLYVKGTLGVIATAYRQNYLSRAELDIVFEALLARQDIWISNALARGVWDDLVRTSPEAPDSLAF